MGVSDTSRLRALVRRALNRPFRSDRRASVHILETMVVGMMVVGAVVAVSTFNAPVSQTESFKTSQEELVQDSLDTLAGRPSQDMDAVVFDSLLEEYVMKAVAGQPGPLMGYLNRTLPPGSQYDVFMDTGFGRPLTVVDGGTPSGESLTGARSFVPKMSYVFMVPEFQKYQHDFHMNVLAIPMHNSILQKDEGVPVELAVTFKTEQGRTVTQRAYGETALRHNDPDARSWASSSIYLKDDPYDKDEAPRHYQDSSDMLPYGQASVETVLGGERFGDVYNITIPLVVEESAGHPIPRGAQISVEFPRGWLFDEDNQAWMENELEHWTDFVWDGSDGEGWTISARLLDPLKEGVAPFPITGDFVMLLDSAYPHFQPIVSWMGGGTQGKSTILLKTPQELDAGGFRREAFLSVPKPMISDKESTFGATFANIASKSNGTIEIKKIEFRQPQGLPLFDGLAKDGNHSWVKGDWDWDPSTPGSVSWTPNKTASLAEGEAAWVSMRAIGGPTKDNHYRNHDYQDVLFHYSPQNTTAGSGNGSWSHVQRAHQMKEEYVFRQMVPPLEDDGWPGWPDAHDSYWFGGESRQQNRYAVGNSSYEVEAEAALAQIFGDYQGDHVLSQISLTDPYGEDTRTFSVEDRVHIKNDFTALFTRLSTLDIENVDVSVENIEIISKVYTPEKAWTGIPTKTYKEDASYEHLTGTFGWLLPVDLTQNGILDLVAVDTSGVIYALDGRDGSKLWNLKTKVSIEEAILSEVTGDDVKELVIAGDDTLHSYRLGIDLSDADRKVWSLALDPTLLDAFDMAEFDSDAARVTALEDLTDEDTALGDPAIAIAYSSTTKGGSVFLVSSDQAKNGSYEAALVEEHVSDTTLDDYTWMPDMVRLQRDLGDGQTEEYLAVASTNGTVTVFGLPGLDLHWITSLPQRPHNLAAADLTGDGWDDLVVNTAAMAGVEENDKRMGDSVYVLPGRTGQFGPGERDLDSLLSVDFKAREARTDAKGWTAAVGGTSDVVQDHSGFYNPFLGPPGVGVCNLAGENGLVDTGFAEKPAEEVAAWLSDQKWSGVHLDSGDGSLYIVSQTGAVLQAVEDCPDGRLRWDVVAEGSSEAGPFIGVHAYDAYSADGSLYRMNESGQIERFDGSSKWNVVADVCALANIDPCDETVVNRWSVEEDVDGLPVRFWATLEWVNPADADDRKSFLVSVKSESFATPEDGEGEEDELSNVAWVLEQYSTTHRFHALKAGTDGEVHFGGSSPGGGAFLMYRESQAKPFEEHRMFYSAATSEHGGLLLDVLKTSSGGAWAVSEDGQVWKRASSDTWVPYPSWAQATKSAALTEDPAGSVWLFMEGADFLPLRTHEPKTEFMFEVPVPTSDGYQVEVDAEEAHLETKDAAVTKISWYARSSGVHESGLAHPWMPLESSGIDQDLGDGWKEHPYLAILDDIGKSESVQVKAVLETRSVTGADGTIDQDAGLSPGLRNTQITVKWDDEVLNSVTFSPGEAQTMDDHSQIDPVLGAYTLDHDSDGWMYRGGRNTEYAVNPPDVSSHNRRVDVGESLLGADAATPGVAIADQSLARFDWWVLDGLTGLPERPSTGPEGMEFAGGYVDKMFVGDVTDDGVDDVVIVGDLEGDTLAHIWDTQDDEWSLLDGFGDHIIQAAVLMGKHQGKQTFVVALPASSFNLVPQTLGAEADESNSLASFFGPDYDEDQQAYDTPELRWASAPHITQGFTTFSYEIPRNSLYGTSIVVSELKFDLTSSGKTVTQTARLLDWFDILPPGRTKSVPPVYTVEVVAWFDEGYGHVERRSVDGTDPDSGGGGLSVIPDPKDGANPNNVS